MNEVTHLLERIDQGDPRAAAELLPLVYDELRKLAAAKLAHEQPGLTLQATALVHEAYLRLVGAEQSFDGRGHFFAACAEAMRRILVEQARKKQAEIHGGGRQRVALQDDHRLARATPDEIVALDDSLARLALEDPAAARVIQLRLFAGLSVEEAAAALGLSRAAAYRHWTFGRAWLLAERQH